MRGRKAKPQPQDRKVVGYVRVSTEDQAGDGVSLAAQRERIAAYCTALGMTLAGIVEDAGHSAKSLKRPGMQRILAGVKAGEIAAVVAVKLDRLTRSVRDLVDLLDTFAKHDAALVSVGESLDTSSAAGRMVVNMLGVVAQWERETIGERTASALAHLRKRGKAYSRSTPFGYRRVDDQLVADASQQHALAEARRMHGNGASYRQIAARLTEMGAKPNGGAKQWHAASVRKVLQSRMTLAQAQ